MELEGGTKRGPQVSLHLSLPGWFPPSLRLFCTSSSCQNALLKLCFPWGDPRPRFWYHCLLHSSLWSLTGSGFLPSPITGPTPGFSASPSPLQPIPHVQFLLLKHPEWFLLSRLDPAWTCTHRNNVWVPCYIKRGYLRVAVPSEHTAMGQHKAGGGETWYHDIRKPSGLRA